MGFLKKLFGSISSSSSSSLDDLFVVAPQLDCIFKNPQSIRDATTNMSLDDAMKHAQMFWHWYSYVQGHWTTSCAGIAAMLANMEHAMTQPLSPQRQTAQMSVQAGFAQTRDTTCSNADHDEYLWHNAISEISRNFGGTGNHGYRTTMAELWNGAVALWGSANAAQAACDVMCSTLILHDVAVHESILVGTDDVPTASLQFPTFVQTPTGYTMRTYWSAQ